MCIVYVGDEGFRREGVKAPRKRDGLAHARNVSGVGKPTYWEFGSIATVEGATMDGARREPWRFTRASSSEARESVEKGFEKSSSLRATSGCLTSRCSRNRCLCSCSKSSQYEHMILYACRSTRCVLSSCCRVKLVSQMWHKNRRSTGRPESRLEVINGSAASRNCPFSKDSGTRT